MADDNNYVATGYTTSTNGDVTGNHGQQDAWLLKIDPNGKLLSSKSIGGPYNDNGQALFVNNTYIILTGATQSNDGDFYGIHGQQEQR